jgi:hypothetical protein
MILDPFVKSFTVYSRKCILFVKTVIAIYTEPNCYIILLQKVVTHLTGRQNKRITDQPAYLAR